MIDYNLLIKEKREDTDFDGKKTIYKKDTFFDLLKDVMAMANADIETDRHIVTGISLQQGEERLTGINQGDFQDPSIYQQLVHDNIEPTIDLRCFLHEFEGKFFGIFEISNCNDPPYMMKKIYPRKQGLSENNKKTDILQVGEAWIRKNTDQDRMISVECHN
jgi:predicted HTH transcriptional regulator